MSECEHSFQLNIVKIKQNENENKAVSRSPKHLHTCMQKIKKISGHPCSGL